MGRRREEAGPCPRGSRLGPREVGREAGAAAGRTASHNTTRCSSPQDTTEASHKTLYLGLVHVDDGHWSTGPFDNSAAVPVPRPQEHRPCRLHIQHHLVLHHHLDHDQPVRHVPRHFWKVDTTQKGGLLRRHRVCVRVHNDKWRTQISHSRKRRHFEHTDPGYVLGICHHLHDRHHYTIQLHIYDSPVRTPDHDARVAPARPAHHVGGHHLVGYFCNAAQHAGHVDYSRGPAKPGPGHDHQPFDIRPHDRPPYVQHVPRPRSPTGALYLGRPTVLYSPRLYRYRQQHPRRL